MFQIEGRWNEEEKGLLCQDQEPLSQGLVFNPRPCLLHQSGASEELTEPKPVCPGLGLWRLWVLMSSKRACIKEISSCLSWRTLFVSKGGRGEVSDDARA